MEDKSDNILAQILELRAEAGKSLQGNEYFAVAYKLDALLADGNPDGADMQAGLQAIRSRLFPAIPDVAEPAVTDGADEAAFEDIRTLRGELAEALHGNDYFAAALKIDALVAGGDLSSPATQETIQSLRDRLASGSKQEIAPTKNENLENVIALRENAGKKLQGNGYFSVALRLDALLAAGDLGAAPAEETLEQIRAIIEAGQETAATPAQLPDAEKPAPNTENTEEQVTEPEAVTSILFPKANSFSAPQPTVAVKLAANKDDEAGAPDIDTGPEGAQEATPVSDDMTPEADTVPENAETPAETAQQDVATEEKNGFDALAEASWLRVREVSVVDEVPAQGMNGADIASDAEAAETAETQVPAEEKASVGAQEPVAERQLETASASGTTFKTSQSAFKVTPRPTIINRPVKKERFVRLKRLAKLAHLPIRKD